MWETAISPLRFAPVEMTKLGVIAGQTFLNPIFILLGGPQAHEHSGRDDKVGVVASDNPGAPKIGANPAARSTKVAVAGWQNRCKLID